MMLKNVIKLKIANVEIIDEDLCVEMLK